MAAINPSGLSFERPPTQRRRPRRPRRAVTLLLAACDQRRREISRRFIAAVNPDLLYHLVRLQSAGR
jgi:hypothetical protein